MFCQHCGQALPANASRCPACGAAIGNTARDPASLEELLSETKHAAKDLAKSTAQLSKRLLSKAQSAAKDPSGSAKKVAHRTAKELEAAAREIDRILRDL
ncbi:MAG: zinc-ribbon domain-containing protein [Candidatus Lutacidiplasmatales archaeon]